MLVQCPNCKTTYKVSDEVLKGVAPAFRCSRCRHTFELEADEPAQTSAETSDAAATTEQAPAQDQELSFSFPPKEVAEPALTDQATPEIPRAMAEQAGSKEDSADDHWSLHGHDSADALEPRRETPFTIPELNSAGRPDTSFTASDEFNAGPAPLADDQTANDTQNILPMSSYMDQQASILPYLTLFTLLVIGYALAAVISHAHPKGSEELVKKIPLFGSAVLKNTHLKDGILLQSLRGSYQSIQGNREVFVVTGVAVNQNPVVIREVQLTGKILTGAGKELEEQNVWVGNTLSAKILRGMTLEDIPHLQSLKPLKSFEMPPGDSVPFAIVFLKAARGVKEFSCAVSFADADA